MRRLDKFLISKAPYAVDLDSMTIATLNVDDYIAAHRVDIQAVWFRRRQGVTVACVGYLWDITKTPPPTALAFVEGHNDGRYGGNTTGRWNGTGYWGHEDPKVQAVHLELLRPMLDNYPNIPEGFDGWWTFK